MMSLVISLITVLVFFLYLASAIAFLKAKDVYSMSQITLIANCYIAPLILIAIEIQKFSWLSFAKIIFIIFLNVIIVNLICHAICKRAISNKITPDIVENKN